MYYWQVVKEILGDLYYEPYIVNAYLNVLFKYCFLGIRKTCAVVMYKLIITLLTLCITCVAIYYVVLAMVWLQGQSVSGHPVKLGADHTGTVITDSQLFTEGWTT